MAKFNLSDWALRHRSLVWYLLIVSLIAGGVTYMGMGREEDPAFTIKTMIIQAALPGATAEETVTQVTDRIEKKLQELPSLKNTRSVTYPGRTIVYVDLLDTTRAEAITDAWSKVRDMMADIRGEFPQEFKGFSFNDSFGDVYGNIYAFTADGFSPRELRDRVEAVRTKVIALDQAGKVGLVGARDEVVYIEFSTRRLAALGFDRQQVITTLAAQNAIVPSGVIEAGDERILVRVPGQFDSAQSIAAVNLRVGDRFYSLADLGEVRRGYVDPPANLFRYGGRDAIGLTVGMKPGGNILNFGAELDTVMADVVATLPIGIEMHKVADQPKVVDEAVGHFVKAFIEAVGIVLAVSFISLGLRAGLVVTMTIPLVLAMTFVILDYFGITLQRISLGALIIALGLLVDDAMIAIETMISRLEQGETREAAASYAWTSIAFPMLSGTLVTVAGFIPIGLNSSAAGEFTFSLFVVITVSLLLSWVVAVLFAPILGVTFLPKTIKHNAGGPGLARRVFHGVLRRAMRARWLTIAATVALFAVSLWGMKFVEQQFFPLSDRTELVIDLSMRQNSSFAATNAEIARIEAYLAKSPDVSFWTAYVGQGAPRFVLSYDVPTPGAHMGQIVIQTPDIAARDRLKGALDTFGREELIAADVLVKYLEVGPPVGKPVQYRVSGPDFATLRDAARGLATVLAEDARVTGISLDWAEPARVVRLDLDQDKARQLGLSSQDIAIALSAIFDGATVTQLRDAEYLVDLVVRGQSQDRGDLAALWNLQIPSASGAAIPLGSFATLSWGTEQPLIHQRDRAPTITVKAGIATNDQPATIDADMRGQIDAYAATLPKGYLIEVGGTVESSAESQAPIAAVVPMMLIVMLTLVMVQMQSFRLSFIVLAAAPLGLIGVVAALVASGAPLGFVAILGVLALIGILIRNSIILVNEIEVLYRAGRSRWDAVFEASDSRARPILLTAAAASLALIPISSQIFWGPMAYAMMGGIIAGTLITLVFVPALYCAVFAVERPAPAKA
ncbi:MAG: multidrug efflux pump subunit AcrB [Paracoccaceae bacterium]|jgi:multidrug efflux pump subunit AcrB